MPFPATFELSDIDAGDGSQGFVMFGPASIYSVAGAGDINGDGIDDFIVGSSQADPTSTRTNAGQSYVVFGNAAGFPSDLNLATLDGTNGFVLNGIDRNDFSGFSVAGAGDVNGDGIGDLIVGAYGGDPGGRSSAGETYIVYGTDAGFSASLELSALNGTNGFVINGINGSDQSGQSVAGAGDINGDGIDDLIIGASFASPGGDFAAGQSYVVFGTAAGTPASLNLSALNGTNGFVLTGIDAIDFSGASVASAGDLNGDGFGDIVIGAYAADPGGLTDAGETYVVFGSATGFSASLDLSTLNGTNGFVLNGVAANDVSGFVVASAGDVNGDGIDDLMIGGYAADPGGRADAGSTYIVFGTAAGFTASFDLSTLNGTNGFVINGIAADDLSGIALAGAGDVNGDGIEDMIIGGYTADPGGRTDAGQTYVVFGTAAGFGASLDLSTLDGTNGFAINGTGLGTNSGFAVAGAGDVNSDGYDDLLVGSFAGSTYIIFGRPLGQTEGSSGNDVLVGARGQDTLNGYEGNDTLIGGGSGDVLSGGAGDDFYDSVDLADTIIELADEGTDTVRTRFDYTLGDNVENLLLFGIAINGSGNVLDNRITGTSGDNSLYGFGGDDVLAGLGGADTLYGGAGDDFYDAVTFADTVVELADEGIDTISTRANNYILGDNVENLVLIGNVAETGSGNALNNRLEGSNRSNTLSGFDGGDVLEGMGGIDTLDGGAGNDRLQGGDGNDLLTGGEGNDTLIGGAGRDSLTGGAGGDGFVFFDGDFAGLSPPTDTIADFSRSDGDLINLSALDAIVGTPENEDFAFVGTAAFSSTAGELRYIQRDGFAVIQGDTDGDGLADFQIRVDGVADLIAADFMF